RRSHLPYLNDGERQGANTSIRARHLQR
ncbi:hypothetical protein CCACVL1_24643, partial [Corchorus capsularis]